MTAGKDGREANAADTPDPPTPPTSVPDAARTRRVPPRVPPLTEEELALIEKDPRNLSPEDRRRRAHALRKQILQNPDGPAAKELERWRQMYESKELELPDEPGKQRGPTLHAPTRKGTSAADVPSPR
ncbi:MAG: hypothetical protein D6705_18355 [Deltaproteobacteria bacterium]|nr:MAG: hypothetical protein D6705_18355 [Deltaproteobacteria bacterium]